jgi:hypothetical protein
MEGVGVMPSADHDPVGHDRLTATWVELAIRLSVLGLLLLFSSNLIRPFITIAIWSVVQTVALYPCMIGSPAGWVDAVGWRPSRLPSSIY